MNTHKNMRETGREIDGKQVLVITTKFFFLLYNIPFSKSAIFSLSNLSGIAHSKE